MQDICYCSFARILYTVQLCIRMHQQSEHVMNFLLAELGTNVSPDGQQRLVVKGRFEPKNFEGILRHYINEYVICLGCKSQVTTLSKENRLLFLRCEKIFTRMTVKITNLRPRVASHHIKLVKCGSGRSFAPIKAGFVAPVGHRNAGT